MFMFRFDDMRVNLNLQMEVISSLNKNLRFNDPGMSMACDLAMSQD